jgi:hypothetical protein
MADEAKTQPKILMRFRANVKSPTIEIAQGEYRRKFYASEQPFEVENAEEARMLHETGHFVEDKEAEKAALTDVESEAAGTVSTSPINGLREIEPAPLEETRTRRPSKDRSI